MREHFKFLAHFVRSPFSVGAIAPSSRWLARRMVQGIDTEHARTIVELGPGTGAFTGAILQAIHGDASLFAVELNPDFASSLSKKFPGVTVIQDSAERLRMHLERHGRDHADEVLCGLPWASFGSDLQNRIMDGVVDALRPGGQFATFAYIHASWFPTARAFLRLLESRFSTVRSTPIVWRNLPPAFVYRCTK